MVWVGWDEVEWDEVEWDEVGWDEVKWEEGKWDEAKSAYDQGFVHIYVHKDEWGALMNQAQRDEFDKCKAVLHSNRCMARVKMEKWDDAIWDADKSIELTRGGNVKGYYRRCLIYQGFIERELAKEEQKKFWDIDKVKKFVKFARADLNACVAGSEDGKTEDHSVKKARFELDKKERLIAKYEGSYKNDQKKLYGEKMVGGLDKKYSKMKVNAEKRKEIKKDEGFEDMIALASDSDDEDDDSGVPPNPPDSRFEKEI